MADASTTYDVNIRYIAHDHMTPPTRKIVGDLDAVSKSTSNVTMGLGKLGAVVAGVFGFNQARKALIDFNSDLEQNRITMAGLWQQYKGGDFTDNLERASELVKKLQIDARASVGTTKDFVQMASMLAGPIAMAGGNMDQLQQMTKSAVVGAKAFSMDWQVAARDVDQALRGQYHSVDQFTGKLLSPMGYSGETGRAKFNQMSASQRFSELQRAMNSQALADMAKAQETSFAGVTSTLVDNLQMTLGKIGLPLFKEITKEVARWNDWLDKNQGTIERIANDLGGKIVSAAKSFYEFSKFAAEHWKSILGVWAAGKSYGALSAAVGQMGAVKGAASAAEGLAGAGAAGTFGAKAAGVTSKLAVASIVASAVYIGATELANYIDEKQSEGLAREMREGPGTTAAALDAMLKYGETKDAMQKDVQARIFTQLLKSNGINSVDSFRDALDNMSGDERLRYASALGMNTKGFESDYIRGTYGPQMLADAIAQKMGEMFDRKGMTDAWNALHDSLTPGTGLDVPTLPFQNKFTIPKPEKPKVNITIQHIEVQSDDPDRFVFNLGRAGADAIANPSASRFQRKFREG